MEAKDNMDNLTKSEVKLLIDNSLLEQEKRLSKEFRDELASQTDKLINAVEKQNKMYSDQIIALNKDITKLDSIVSSLQGKISGIKAQMVVVATACATLGGLVGFFVAELIR